MTYDPQVQGSLRTMMVLLSDFITSEPTTEEVRAIELLLECPFHSARGSDHLVAAGHKAKKILLTETDKERDHA